MTRREREIIRKSLREIMADDGDFITAVADIGKLVGLDFPAAHALKSIRNLPIRKLAKMPNQEFKAR